MTLPNDAAFSAPATSPLTHLSLNTIYHGHRTIVGGKGTRRITVAFRIAQIPGDPQGFQIHYGAGFCSPNETFDRKRGNAIATGRLNKRPSHYHLANRKATIDQVVNFIVAQCVTCMVTTVGTFADLPDSWRDGAEHTVTE
jgi:hypothetical protein